MEEKNWIGTNIWYVLGAMALGFFMIRFIAVGRFFLIALLIVVPIVAITYFLIQRFSKKAASKGGEEQKALAVLERLEATGTQRASSS